MKRNVFIRLNLKLIKENGELIKKVLKEQEESIQKSNQLADLYEESKKSKTSPQPKINLSPEEKKNIDDFYMSDNTEGQKGGLPSKPKFKINAHAKEVNCVIYENNGGRVATAGGDCKIKLWDTTSGKEKSNLVGFIKPVTSLSFSADGAFLAAASVEKTLKYFNLKTERVVHTYTGHTDSVYAVVHLMRNPIMVSGSLDRSIKFWDVNKGVCIRTVSTFSSCYSLAATNIDNMIISGHTDGALRFWSAKGELMYTMKDVHSEVITSLEICSTNCHVLTNSRDHNLKYIDLNKYSVVKTLESDNYSNQSSSSRACLSTGEKYALAGGNKKIVAFNIETEKEEKVIEGIHKGRVFGVAWQPNGQQFCSIDSEGSLMIW